ncbi:hypothetical protein DPMN_145712 [Dreissena polymorpha]|uniref:Uncharacterized protein n=1 Tax=Dreissena polymorpha TaxID=45954 RepID=A0A9D4F906_DREPO|nr:hypothetical protein DPMN_145712 [Dreissena polymorpha]
MLVVSRQSASLPMYHSYTETLPAFNGAPPGHHWRQSERCCSSCLYWPWWSYSAVPVDAIPVVPSAAPVVAGPSQFIP